MDVREAKRRKKNSEATTSHNDSKHTDNDQADSQGNVTKLEAEQTYLEYSVLSNQLILDHIMSYLSYKDVCRLSLCCREFNALSSLEFERRKIGTASKLFLFQHKNTLLKPMVDHPKCDANAIVYRCSNTAQQEVAPIIDQLNFCPKIAFIFTGGHLNSDEYRRWTVWFKLQMPNSCTLMNVQSKEAICGSVNERVYEVRHDRKYGVCGLAYLLFATQSENCGVKLFKNMNELLSLTVGQRSSEEVKCILYFTKFRSRQNLSKILSVCKERNNDLSIAFGGLIIDALASFISANYTSKIECAGLVFTGSSVKAASTVIEEMNNDHIRNSMIRFRDSIEFDINDRTKHTICFLLSCIEHSPHINSSLEYTESESDIFHTIFPSNVKAFGLSGHGEFGQVSGIKNDQRKIHYQFSCVMVLVQFPKK